MHREMSFMNKTKVAISLLVVALILLVIYGSDVAIGSIHYKQQTGRAGFLPINESLRGIIFGIGAVVLSVAGFIVARREFSNSVSLLLFVNGGLIVTGLFLVMSQNAGSSGSAAQLRTIGPTLATGILLICLGLWKLISDRKKTSIQRKV